TGGSDTHRGHGILVLLVVRGAGVAHRVGSASDGLNENVGVLAGGVGGGRAPVLPQDHLMEAVVGAGIRTGAAEAARLGRELRVDIRPVQDAAAVFPAAGQGLDRDAAQEGVGRVDYHGHAVLANLEQGVLDAVGLTVFDFAVGDGARGVGDRGLTAA